MVKWVLLWSDRRYVAVALSSLILFQTSMQCQGTTSKSSVAWQICSFQTCRRGHWNWREWIGFFQRSGPMDLHMFAFDPVRTYPDTTWWSEKYGFSKDSSLGKRPAPCCLGKCFSISPRLDKVILSRNPTWSNANCHSSGLSFSWTIDQVGMFENGMRI